MTLYDQGNRLEIDERLSYGATERNEQCPRTASGLGESVKMGIAQTKAAKAAQPGTVGRHRCTARYSHNRL